MISVQHLTFDYPGKRALHHVSFSIEPGSITALVGPNGAGKSTLLRCLAGLSLPIHGTLKVDGLDVLQHPREIHLKMGYLPDVYGIYEDLTVEQCLLYHGLAQNIPSEKCHEQVVKVAERMQILELLPQKAGTLSRGQIQRLAIAQTIIHHPKVLLLDEPASGLDPEARDHLSQLLIYLSGEGITIIVSSHILTELEDYSTHMMILRDGFLVKHCEVEGSEKRMMDIYLEASRIAHT